MSEEELVRQAYIKGFNDALKRTDEHLQQFLSYERYELSHTEPSRQWKSSRNGQPFASLLEDIKPKEKECSHCGGCGLLTQYNESWTCGTCNGTGKVN